MTTHWAEMEPEYDRDDSNDPENIEECAVCGEEYNHELMWDCPHCGN